MILNDILIQRNELPPKVTTLINIKLKLIWLFEFLKNVIECLYKNNNNIHEIKLFNSDGYNRRN